MSAWRKMRIQRLIDKRDDLQHYVWKWGFGRKPSELRKLDVQIEKLNRKLERLEAPND